MDLLSWFGVEAITNINDVNIVGLDFGDGDFCASLAEIKDRKIEVNGLFADEGRARLKEANVLFIPQAPDAESITAEPPVVGKAALDMLERRTRTPGKPYCNFKKCPGSNAADSAYDRNDFSSPTNTELMQKAFNAIVNKLFEYNSSINRNKRTLLLVGRPASGGWKKAELEYARMLKEKLNIANYHKQIDVVVVSESLSALARETMPSVKNIRRNENVLIIDCGSSTFDVTLVINDSIPADGEYSRQFGANLIEEKMLEQCFKNGYDSSMLVNAYDKLMLRERKEAYYGERGDNGTDLGTYYVFLNTPNGSCEETLRINEEFMRKVIHETPVWVGSSSTEYPDEGFESWYSACDSVFRKAKERVDACLKAEHCRLDKIIITGGASIMPEVKQLIIKNFGIEPVRTKFPNFSVGEGLAYLGAVEVLKAKELKAMVTDVYAIIDNTYNIEGAVADYCSEMVWNQITCTLQAWKDGSPASMDDWFRSFKAVFEGTSLNDKTHDALVGWYTDQDINAKINGCLYNRFTELFPDFKEKFSFGIDTDSVNRALSGQSVTIHVDWRKIFGFYLKSNSEVLNLAHRERRYNNAIKRQSETKGNIRNEYFNQLNLSANIRKNLKAALLPSLEKHVDNMTPYFNILGQA